MAVIGIDLGMRYSAAARCVNGCPEIIPLEGRPALPSVVSLLKSGKIEVGWAAKNNQAKAPHNTVIEVKRKMGKDEPVSLGEKQFSPQEISAMILMRIKEKAQDQLGEPVTGAVISCPAYFKNPARAATEEAGELAGLRVLRIINEPTAAAYAYGVHQGSDETEKLYVVYDLEENAFDATVIKMLAGSPEVIGTGGDPESGGGNFDDRIVDWMLQRIEEKNPGYMTTLTVEKREALKLRLKIHAEEGKIKLCDTPGEDASYQFQIANVDVFQGLPIIFNETLTRPMFEGMIRDLLENSLKWVDEALKIPKEKYKYKESDLAAILLVGGSTLVPAVRRVLEERFPHTPVWGAERGINPDETVALGASIVAAELDPDSEAPATGAVLCDVTGHTLSFAVFDEARQRKVLHPIIPKETPIPCSGAFRFVVKAHQDRALIELYEGEGQEIDPSRAERIATFDIKIAPIEGPTPLQVALELNENGILVAHATDEFSGQRVSCRMDYKGGGRMSPEELARKKTLLQRQLQGVIAQTADLLAEQPAARTHGTVQPGDTALARPGSSHMRSAAHEAQRGSPNMPGGRIDHVHFSVISLDMMPRGSSHLLDVWAHLGRQRRQVIERAREEAGGREIIIRGKGPVAVERGTVLTVTLQIREFQVDPPQDTIRWEGEIGNAQFSVTVPCDATEGMHQGVARIFVDGIPLMRLFFEICVRDLKSDSGQLPLREKRYRKVFASYASEDRAIVLGRIHGMLKVIPDLDVFTDILSLRSGEHWQERLRDEIRARDALYLFWSLAASRSEWVDWEWRCALKERGIDFIDPVPLVSAADMPPPKELTQLHFNDPILAFIAGAGESGTTGRDTRASPEESPSLKRNRE